jgi:hypothetical protein
MKDSLPNSENFTVTEKRVVQTVNYAIFSLHLFRLGAALSQLGRAFCTALVSRQTEPNTQVKKKQAGDGRKRKNMKLETLSCSGTESI